jgi:predicted kinase
VPEWPQARLIVFGGLPGTGETTIARELTRRLTATYLRIDIIEQRLREAGLVVGASGYVIAYALATENLLIGRTMIADCVNPVAASRNGWRDTADQCAAHPQSVLGSNLQIIALPTAALASLSP